MATTAALTHARQFLQPVTAGDPGDPRMTRMTLIQTAQSLADLAQQHKPLQDSMNSIHTAVHAQAIEKSDATKGRNAGFPRIVQELRTPGNHIHGSARLVSHSVLSRPDLAAQMTKLAADPDGYAAKINQAVAGVEDDFASAVLATSADNAKTDTYRERVTQAGQDLGQLLTGGELPTLSQLTGTTNNLQAFHTPQNGKLPEGFRLSPLAQGNTWLPKNGYGSAEGDDWVPPESGAYQGQQIEICSIPATTEAGTIICVAIIVVVVIIICASK